MQTKTYISYKFDELSKKSKEHAIEHFRDININYDWWQYNYEDAEEIGLKIESFDLDRNRHAKGYFLESASVVADNIIKTHGSKCDTYKTAQNYLSCEGEEDSEKNFLISLLENYSDILQNECDYRTSDEAIIETIQCNDYNFLENGKLDDIESVKPFKELSHA